MYYEDTRTCRTCHYFRHGDCTKELPLEESFDIYQIAEDGRVSEALTQSVSEAEKYLGSTLSILLDYVPKKKAEELLNRLGSMFDNYLMNFVEIADENISNLYQGEYLKKVTDKVVTDTEFYCKEWE